ENVNRFPDRDGDGDGDEDEAEKRGWRWSFDVNKPGCEEADLKGGVAGGSILK
nr:eukaryotic translation initiation factor 2 subunit gamma [Tanacetum cinerariifolium]